MTPRQRVDLSPLHTFGSPAVADHFLELSDPVDIDTAGRWLNEHPGSLILGDGSNMLIAAERVPAVLQVSLAGRQIMPDTSPKDDSVMITAGAGENWHALVEWTLAQGLNGLENLALIPGRVGAAPVQNIGAYGVDIAQFIVAVEALDLGNGRRMTLSTDDCAFGYRDSLFKQQPGRWLITRVTLALARQPRLMLDYGDIRSELRVRDIVDPNARDVADAVIRIRRRRLPDPARLGNAGSFFKNPILPVAQIERLRDEHPDLPVYPAAPGSGKVAAGWLIEACGFKGVRRGGAGVHESHALVLVNHGGATGQQLLALAAEIQACVRDRFGIGLEPEPLIIHPA